MEGENAVAKLLILMHPPARKSRLDLIVGFLVHILEYSSDAICFRWPEYISGGPSMLLESYGEDVLYLICE